MLRRRVDRATEHVELSPVTDARRACWPCASRSSRSRSPPTCSTTSWRSSPRPGAIRRSRWAPARAAAWRWSSWPAARRCCSKRDYVVPDDIKQVAVPALAHRVTLRPELWVRQVSSDEVVAKLLSAVPTPKTDPAAAGERPRPGPGCQSADVVPARAERTGCFACPGPSLQPHWRSSRHARRLLTLGLAGVFIATVARRPEFAGRGGPGAAAARGRASPAAAAAHHRAGPAELAARLRGRADGPRRRRRRAGRLHRPLDAASGRRKSGPAAPRPPTGSRHASRSPRNAGGGGRSAPWTWCCATAGGWPRGT